MKKRVLFIDDDMMVLQSMKRVLYPMQQEWEMGFVDSGPKALESMAEKPFDVVISDMLMPGMNGAQLLDQVKKLYPATVRFILSGHATAEDALKNTDCSIHQIFSKPVDVDALKSAVQNASVLEELSPAVAA